MTKIEARHMIYTGKKLGEETLFHYRAPKWIVNFGNSPGSSSNHKGRQDNAIIKKSR